LGTHSL